MSRQIFQIIHKEEKNYNRLVKFFSKILYKIWIIKEL